MDVRNTDDDFTKPSTLQITKIEDLKHLAVAGILHLVLQTTSSCRAMAAKRLTALIQHPSLLGCGMNIFS
jgi:hypothetical protein